MIDDDEDDRPQPSTGAGFERFRRLERERTAPLDVATLADAGARFGAVPLVPAGASAAPSSAAPTRFQVPEPAVPDPGERSRDDEQPFVVCAACDTEGGKYATRCHICGASYDTPAQRAFNEKIWAERKVQREAERAEAASRASAMEEAGQAEAQRRQKMLESLARDVRLEYESPLRGFDFQKSPLLSLLRKLPRPYGILVGVALVLVPLAASVASRTGSFNQSLAEAVLLLVLGAFVPPSWYGMDRW